MDIPHVKQDCDDIETFFRKEYNLSDESVHVLHDQDLQQCNRVYSDLWKTLKADQSKRTLIIHVFAGHAVQLDGQQALLINHKDA